MHFPSVTCYKMATICQDENSKVSRRKKTRRGKRIRNEEEKRRLINEYMKQRKHKVAPLNTTQFIIEDRERVEPILFLSPRTSLCSLSSPEATENTEFDLSLSEEEDNFDEQYFLNDFEVTYRELCRENLHTFSKLELLEKVKDLENRRDHLEKQWRCRRAEERVDNCENTNKSDTQLTSEFEQLLQQNNALREENEMLRKDKNLEGNIATVC